MPFSFDYEVMQVGCKVDAERNKNRNTHKACIGAYGTYQS